MYATFSFASRSRSSSLCSTTRCTFFWCRTFATGHGASRASASSCASISASRSCAAAASAIRRVAYVSAAPASPAARSARLHHAVVRREVLAQHLVRLHRLGERRRLVVEDALRLQPLRVSLLAGHVHGGPPLGAASRWRPLRLEAQLLRDRGWRGRPRCSAAAPGSRRGGAEPAVGGAARRLPGFRLSGGEHLLAILNSTEPGAPRRSAPHLSIARRRRLDLRGAHVKFAQMARASQPGGSKAAGFA